MGSPLHPRQQRGAPSNKQRPIDWGHVRPSDGDSLDAMLDDLLLLDPKSRLALARAGGVIHATIVPGADEAAAENDLAPLPQQQHPDRTFLTACNVPEGTQEVEQPAAGWGSDSLGSGVANSGAASPLPQPLPSLDLVWHGGGDSPASHDQNGSVQQGSHAAARSHHTPRRHGATSPLGAHRQSLAMQTSQLDLQLEQQHVGSERSFQQASQQQQLQQQQRCRALGKAGLPPPAMPWQLLDSKEAIAALK